MLNDKTSSSMALAIRWLLPALLAAAVLSPCCALSQAPGDEDEFCLDISSAPAYASSVKPLLDSWSYVSLLSETEDSLWKTVHLDNDTLGWMPVPSSICQEAMRVIEPSAVPQDNWLITQYINKSMGPLHSYPVTIFVNVSYTFESECAAVNCASFVELLYYLSNDSDRPMVFDASQYTFLANLTSNAQASSSNAEGDAQEIQFSTSNFTIHSEDGGLYLAVRDVGANVTIHRILVYRLIGPMKQLNLTLLPETPAPIEGPIIVPGTCVANSNSTSGGTPSLTLSHNGDWTDIAQCVCIEGHYWEEIGGVPACVACDAGEYKATEGNGECLPCPDNSQSHDRGAAICPCLPSYYRNMTEGAEHPCTGPPSFPQDVTITEVTSSSAVVYWDPPSDDGGRTDTFYNISYTLFSGQSTPTYPEQDPIFETNYTLTKLEPCSIYYVQVIAENGVSSLAGGEGQRLVGQFMQTTEGVPPITHVEVLDQLYIYWTPLTDDCVAISEYHIQFRVTEDDDQAAFIAVPSNESLYMVDLGTDLPSSGEPIYVVVRGNSSEEEPGDWSEPVLFAQKNPNAPSTSVPTATSTMAPSETMSSSSLSSPSSTGATNPTGGPGTATPSTSPTSSSSDGAVLSIVFVLLGAFVIIILASTGALVYWLIRRYCNKYFKHLLPMESSYMSVKLTRSKVGAEEEGKVEFIDGSRDYEDETDGTEDTLDLIKKK